MSGDAPIGRNGHTATLLDEHDTSRARHVLILGGWLGSGPFAAADAHVLQIDLSSDDDLGAGGGGGGGGGSGASSPPLLPLSKRAPLPPPPPPTTTTTTPGMLGGGTSALPSHRRRLAWVKAPFKGSPPGPCNMHTSDLMPCLESVLVFRGGDGKAYLSDLHRLHVKVRSLEGGGSIAGLA